jgi:hypothetical protein
MAITPGRSPFPSPLYKSQGQAPVWLFPLIEPPHPLLTSTCAATHEARTAAPVFCSHRFRSPLLIPATVSTPYELPSISSTSCATHPSPLMPKSPVIWPTRAHSPVAPLQNLTISVRLLRWWTCPCYPLDLLSAFCIPLKALAVRKPHRFDAPRSKFLYVRSFCSSVNRRLKKMWQFCFLALVEPFNP